MSAAAVGDSGRGRARRVRAVQRHSRFVGMMKWLLPTAAAGLVVIVLAWPGALEKRSGMSISIAAVRHGDDALQMVNPRYTGTDREGRPFTVTADTATQDEDDHQRITLSNLQADMTLKNGVWLSMTAPRGMFHQATRTLALRGNVDVYGDNGYEFHAEAIDVDLAEGTAESHTAVNGQGPIGTLRADRLRLEERGRKLYFRGNVRLIFHPDATG